MNLSIMNRTYLLDEITIKSGRGYILKRVVKFTFKGSAKALLRLLEVDNRFIWWALLLEAIRKDLFPQKFVLNLKRCRNAFNILRSTLQKIVGKHVILKKIAPVLAVLC